MEEFEAKMRSGKKARSKYPMEIGEDGIERRYILLKQVLKVLGTRSDQQIGRGRERKGSDEEVE